MATRIIMTQEMDDATVIPEDAVQLRFHFKAAFGLSSMIEVTPGGYHSLSSKASSDGEGFEFEAKLALRAGLCMAYQRFLAARK